MYYILIYNFNLKPCKEDKMSFYQKEYKCIKCDWILKQSVTHIKPLDNGKDFAHLIGTGLKSGCQKCPKCGGNVVPATSKEVE